ncbi:MAG: glycosyltransferase family 2 protein [Pseudobutyrivibrio ruminis]|nr:glycosyltransferase family 2 protein [Pseudobutyrivibrio ruminis]
MKTAFATVIYKQAHAYLQDYVKSVDNQTDRDFTLLIINDNYTKAELAEIEKEIVANTRGISIQIIDLYDKHLSIAETRIEMIRQAKRLKVDLLIMGDADDTFSKDRVASYKKAYELDKQSVFFYNKLVTDKGDEVFKTIPTSTTDVKAISQGNYIGLSTSGIRMNKITEEFLDSLAEGDTPVFDWYLFSRILTDIGSGSLVPDAYTIYRIYDANMAGTGRDLKKEYDIKTIHYNNLAKRYDYFKYLANKLKELNPASLKLQSVHQGYWWSDIQMEDDYEI